MNRGFAAVLAAVIVVGCRPAVVAPKPGAARPKLVVLVVIDQLPTWAWERDRKLFSRGFARLLRDGAYVKGELEHANTFTAPGHASIGTGAPPSVHGIVGNLWYRRADGVTRAAEHDEDAQTFSVLEPGKLIDDFVSPHALRVEGIVDMLRRESPRSRSIVVALKARAAAFMAGKAPELAIWFEPLAGGMTTSKAYAATPPEWLFELARAKPMSRFVGQTWQPLDPNLLARHTRLADEGPGEGDVHRLGVAFPHPVTDGDSMAFTPFGDQVVLDGALAAIGAMQLGEDEFPDLLAISLNAHDYIGHTWGPDSWENLDSILRLDAGLGGLFDALDRKVGKDGWAIVMTSDHGATPLVERGGTQGARRITTKELIAAVEGALATLLGRPGPWVTTVISNQLYFTPKLTELADAERRSALQTARSVLERVQGIEAAYDTTEAGGDCARRRALERAVCLAIVSGESGELMIVPKRGWMISDYVIGTQHDGPNDDNRQVPILVMGSGIAPQTASGSQLQVAPTVAALLGISAPPAATAKPLFVAPARSPARP